MEYIWDLLVNLHWGAVGQIIMIDILLGGDNAVVIAMACRNLPHEQRAKGIFWGTAGAIALRVVLITFAVMLLDLPFLKAAGGLLLLWIGVKLLIPEFDSHEKIEGSSKLLGAIKTIIVADFVMSFDNVIAIAGAAQQAHEAHQTLLIIFGLVVSVPFIVFGSQIILKLLDRFPIIIWPARRPACTIPDPALAVLVIARASALARLRPRRDTIAAGTLVLGTAAGVSGRRRLRSARSSAQSSIAPRRRAMLKSRCRRFPSRRAHRMLPRLPRHRALPDPAAIRGIGARANKDTSRPFAPAHSAGRP